MVFVVFEVWCDTWTAGRLQRNRRRCVRVGGRTEIEQRPATSACSTLFDLIDFFVLSRDVAFDAWDAD